MAETPTPALAVGLLTLAVFGLTVLLVVAFVLAFAGLAFSLHVGTAVDVGRSRPGIDEGRLKLRMYHTHLPMLERMGVVEPDGAASHVRRGSNFDDIVPLLRLFDAHRHELPPDVV